MKKVSTIILMALLSLFVQNSMAQNVIQGGDMEKNSENLWSVSTLNSDAANSSEYEFGSTNEIAFGGVDGNLQFSITNTGTEGAHLMFYQEVTLQGGKQYLVDMAVKTIQGMNNSWFEVYLGTEPVDGQDYGSGQTLLGGFKWSEWQEGCSDEFDVTLAKDGCLEGSGEPVTIEGEGEVKMFLGFKSGIWGAEATIELVVDEVSFTPVETVSAAMVAAVPFTIYPNPSNGMLNVDSDHNITTITILNMVGQQLLQKNAGNSIDVSVLNEGFYLVTIEDVDGGTSTKKFQKR